MKIAFFGTGNMGSALARAIRSHSHEHELYLFNPTVSKSIILAEEIKGHALLNIKDMPKDCDWYFLTFKPQTLSSFDFSFNPSAKIISTLAGVSLETLRNKFKSDLILRLMPNTPSRINKGVNLIYGDFNYDSLKPLLESAGKLIQLNKEELIDQLTPFSGCGPALIFEFARSFEENIFKLTSDMEMARSIVENLFLGSSALIQKGYEQNKTLVDLREEVTSKKGVTYEALKTLENKKFQEMMEEAFLNAFNRTIEIQKGN